MSFVENFEYDGFIFSFVSYYSLFRFRSLYLLFFSMLFSFYWSSVMFFSLIFWVSVIYFFHEYDSPLSQFLTPRFSLVFLISLFSSSPHPFISFFIWVYAVFFSLSLLFFSLAICIFLFSFAEVDSPFPTLRFSLVFFFSSSSSHLFISLSSGSVLIFFSFSPRSTSCLYRSGVSRNLSLPYNYLTLCTT